METHDVEKTAFLVQSFRPNAVFLIQLNVLSDTNCETIFVLQLFCALQDTLIRTEHIQDQNIHLLTYFSLRLEKLLQ